MSRELTALDSVLEVERQVHQQETNLKAQLQKAERRKSFVLLCLQFHWCALSCLRLLFLSSTCFIEAWITEKYPSHSHKLFKP